MLADSIISGEIYDALTEQLDERWRFLERQPPLDVELAPADLVHRVPLLKALSAQALGPVVKSLRSRLALPNELIQGPSKPNLRSILWPRARCLSCCRTPPTLSWARASFFGELYLLKPDAAEFEVRSLGYTKLLELSAKDFKQLIAHDSTLRESIEKVAQERLRALEVGRSSEVSAANSASGVEAV